MTDQPPRYVSYDRWEAEHRSLVERVIALERFADRRRGAEVEDLSLVARITALEAGRKDDAASSERRRNRIWLIALGVMTGVVFPLVVTTVITLLHLRGGLCRRGRRSPWPCSWPSPSRP